MRAAIYARYSSDLQSNRSIEDQLRDCAALCARHGWTVVDSFSDAAISGTTMRRPGLLALLDVASAGGVDVVVAEALDRMSRGLANTAQIHEALEEAGVRIHTISEGDYPRAAAKHYNQSLSHQAVKSYQQSICALREQARR